ncbi:MAG: tetratricopeptide repeat protein [Deltaproteobacteria bacterium]|nr:tetratricopeptide repeat protein [Deltaproteobacteria bacterium]MBW2661350.1 tetratricopeptide repeat protein [Deltaproteobacteria bacterium]
MFFFRSDMLHDRLLMFRDLCKIPFLNWKYFSKVLLLILTAWFIVLPVSGISAVEAEYYSVHVASDKNFNDAAALSDSLRTQGYDSFCETVSIPKKGKWHRVFIGRYKDRDKALKAGKRLVGKGVLKNFIILKVKSENKRDVLHRNVENVENHISSVSAKKEMDLLNPKEDGFLEVVKEGIDSPKTEEVPLLHKKAVQLHKADIDLKVDVKQYDSAMNDFMSGKYEDALSKFKELIETKKNETAMRRIADCYYFLGEKGDKRHISEAIEQYRDIIRKYPGPKKENAQAVYRLAESYNRLNFYYEALIEFKNLCLKYPESDYMPESLYMAGKMYYKTKKFGEAVKKFKEYIKRFPDGKRIRDAYFSVGNCYSQMRQFNDADIWYGNALKKWPDMEDIPENTLLDLGSHYFQTGKHNRALEFFFVYLNLFPDGKHCSDTLYKIARSFEAMGQLRSALKVLSLVVERYPDSVEARNSALIMANIGVKDPKIKLPLYILSGMDYYEDPIKTYKKLAGKFSNFDIEQELISRKGDALIKRRNYKEAFDNYSLLLDKFPYGTYKKEGQKKLVLSASRLIDDYYSKKDYIAVSDVYFNSDKEILFKNGEFDMLLKIGKSLKEMGLLDHAAGFFEEMIGVFGKDKRVSGLSFDMAEIDYDRGSYEDAEKRLNELYGNRLGVDKSTAITAMKLLGDISYKEGLLKEAAGFYLKVLGSEADIEDSAAIREKYADSLKEMGLYSSAMINYKRVLKKCDNGAQKCFVPVIMDSYEGLGDCLYNKGKYQQAISMYERSLINSGESASEGEQNLWILFNIGRGYSNLGNKSMSDKSFSLLKRKNGNEFWSRIVDYYMADKNWADKYGAYVEGLGN